jgi:recombination protein RecA
VPAAPLRALADVRRLLAEQFPDARPLVERDAAGTARPVATRIPALDAALPHGGLPRGKLTAWAPAGGAAAVLRSACRGVVAAGERAAWVDASETLTYGWVRPGAADDTLPLLVRPADRLNALRCAELVLRSGAFALVVLEPPPGGEPVGTETVRLTRATREGGAALVVLTERGAMAALRVTSRLVLHGVRWRRGPFGPAAPVDVRAEVRVRALGWHARAEVTLAVAGYDVRDALDPHAPDRRGGARR